MTSHYDRQNEKLHVARAKGCNHATFADSRATVHATRMQPGSLKALADKVLRRNPVCNSDATRAEKPCNFLPEKSLEKLLRVASEIGTPAREVMDLARRNILMLHTDGRGGLWWTAPEYRDDPGLLSCICELWSEAVTDMFKLMEAGELRLLLGGGRRAC